MLLGSSLPSGRFDLQQQQQQQSFSNDSSNSSAGPAKVSCNATQKLAWPAPETNFAHNQDDT
jgi:hypothetical protein